MPPRHRFRFAVVVFFALTIVAMLLAGRWVWDSARLVPERGGTYVEAIAGRPQYINPLLSQFNAIDHDLASLVFAGLVRIGADGQVEPDLAADWQISPDGKTYTFHLRTDRKWHDGQPVGADDVVTTVKLLQDPDFPGLPDLATLWRDVKVAKLDEHTVAFTLAQPYGPFLEQATIGIVPAHLLGNVPAAKLMEQPFNGSPIGAGPFKVAQVNAQQITLAPDPAYPGPKPYLDAIAFRFYPTANAAVTAVVQGEATGTSYVPPEEVAGLQQNKKLTVLSAPLMGQAAVLFLNTRREPFDDIRVRQAVALTVDRTALIARALSGQAQAAYGPLSPLSWGYRDQPQVGPDPAKARTLLEDAGWTDANGDGVREKEGKPLAIALATSDARAWQSVAETLATQLATVGIKVEVAKQTWDEFRDARLVPRDFTAALAEIWLPNRDPDVLPFWDSSQAEDGFNFSGWRSARADELLQQGREEWTDPAREETYAQFQELFAADVPAVYLYYPLYNFALANDLKGASLAPLLDPSDRFRSINDWYMATKRLFLQ